MIVLLIPWQFEERQNCRHDAPSVFFMKNFIADNPHRHGKENLTWMVYRVLVAVFCLR